MSILEAFSDRHACLTELRRRIGMIERGSFGDRPALALRQEGADRQLPGLFTSLMDASNGGTADRSAIDHVLGDEAIMRPALHEFIADRYGDQSAVRDVGLALVTALLQQQCPRRGGGKLMVLWCQRQKEELEFGRLYGPGLKGLGLSPDQLVVVTGRRDVDCLWAMEQGVCSGSLVAVIGAVDHLDMIASRRLALAAATHRTWCLLLPAKHGRAPSAAETRWCIKALPSSRDERDEKLLGRPRWQLALERNRHGRIGRWIAEWDHEAHRFHLATPMGNQSVAEGNGSNKPARLGDPQKASSDVIAFDRTG